MDETFKSFGLISITVSWAALLFMVYNWRGDRSMSFSKHAAAHPHAFLLMAAIQTITMPLFFVFVVKWFTPAFHLPGVFTICAGLAALGFLIAAWLPDAGGLHSKMHKLTAYTAAWLFIPATTLLAVSPYVATIPKVLAYFVLTYMILSIAWFFTIDSAQTYRLYLQAAYFLGFDLLILAVTYIR